MDDMTLAEMREWAVKEMTRLDRLATRLSQELAETEAARRQVLNILRLIDEPQQEQVR